MERLLTLLRYVCRLLRCPLMPVRRNAVFFCFMWLLGMLCLVVEDSVAPQPIRYSHNPNLHYANPFVELTLDLYVVCLLLMLIPRKAKCWVRGTLAALLYVVGVVDVWCLVHFQSRISPTMLLLVGETNGREAGEFFSSYVTLGTLFTPVGWLVLLGLAHVAVAVWHKPLRQWIWQQLRRVPWRQPMQALAGATLLALLIHGSVAAWDNKESMWRTMNYPTIGGVEREMVRKNANDVMYLPVYRLAFSLKSNHLIAQQLDDLREAEDAATVDSCSYTSPHIVLIIGESYNKHHAALYGYNKPTTPEQQRLARRGLLVPYTDVVAPWNLTSFVFKLVFSTYTVDDDVESDWCNAPLFPTLFRKAGYEVDFLTNQFLPRSKEAIYDFSGGFFLNDEELSHSMFSHRNTRLHTYDEGLLADYDSLAATRPANDSTPRLTIFHLMGQHVEYNQRFPNGRTHFRRSDYQRPDLKQKEVQWVADYDNATRYNDSIVAQIVRRFEGKEAIVIYLADHGEEVYDGIRNKHGRVHSDKIGPRLAHEEYEIPMWIYATPTYQRRHADVWRRVRQQRSQPFMSDALPHTLLWLAGIHTPHYMPQRNILSTDFDATRPRLMKRRVDYNQLDIANYYKHHDRPQRP